VRSVEPYNKEELFGKGKEGEKESRLHGGEVPNNTKKEEKEGAVLFIWTFSKEEEGNANECNLSSFGLRGKH